MTVARKQIQRPALFASLSTWSMMIALFFNPFGFDAVQYWLILQTGNLWYANVVLYGIAVLFFGLSLFFRWRFKVTNKNEKKQIN